MHHRSSMSRREFIQTAASRVATLGAFSAVGVGPLTPWEAASRAAAVPDGVVVLSFDDAVKSHRSFVAPFLKDLGFRATFFVTHRWMADGENFMTWQEIADIHRMGFEIGNHTWTHDDFSTPKNVARLEGELALVERELGRLGVPRPVSFAYPGDTFGPEAVKILKQQGYGFARRGMQPEVGYGEMRVGPTFDPRKHHPLLIPTTGDAYPDWSLEYFQQLVAGAHNGKVVVLQFHGVPDVAHPWVYTPPENFRKYMEYLRQKAFRVIALGDLKEYVDRDKPPADPTLQVTYPQAPFGCPDLPAEVLATRADLPYWLTNMLGYHHYTMAEAVEVCALPEADVRRKAVSFGIYPAPSHRRATGQNEVRILPYPGGRHPRIGFKEGAINPMRGTKASVFLPWDPSSYVVVDLPEAIFCNLGLLFLAHTDIPTVWNDQNIVLENVDWNRDAAGPLSYRRTLPSGVVFGASIRPSRKQVEMDLWLRNFGGHDLSGNERENGLRTQVCVMLKGAPEFNGQTNDNKLFRSPVAAVRSAGGDRWILTAWERVGRVWGNAAVPCMHADPNLPNCRFGETVHVCGRLWFYEGKNIEPEIDRGIKSLGGASTVGA